MCLPQGKPYNCCVTGFLPDALNSIAHRVYPSNWTTLRPCSSHFIPCFYLHPRICRRPLLRMAQRKAKLSSYQFFPLKLYHVTGITPQLRGRGCARSSTRGCRGQAQAGTISVHPPTLPPFQPHPYEPPSTSQVAAQVIPLFMSQGPSQLPAKAGTSMHQEPEEEELDNIHFGSQFSLDAHHPSTGTPSTETPVHPQGLVLPQPPDVVQQTTIDRFQAAAAMIQVASD